MSYIVFKSVMDFYLFDRESSRLVSLTSEEVVALSSKDSETKAKMEEKLRKYGVCFPTKLQKIVHPATDTLEERLAANMHYLVLQVTQSCNLRCEYCAYSGNYYNRSHEANYMSVEVAKKAVDFLFDHSTNALEVGIGFYGGEPLLNFSLIKKIIAYIEEKYSGKAVRYNMTTNATLLTDEIIDYLVEKEFQLVFSIDGPKKIHDMNRRFYNGKGSYDIVMQNLERIKLIYPQFYKKCRTNTVLSPESDINCAKNFFDTDALIGLLSSQMSIISPYGRKNQLTYNKLVELVQEEEHFKLFMELLKLGSERHHSMLYDGYIDDLETINNQIEFNGHLQLYGHPGGPCVIGEKRAFVTVLGDIYPCEKVCENISMCIGNIYEGFEINRVKELMNIARLTENECKLCWAFALCSSCVAAAYDNGNVSRKQRLSWCKSMKEAAIQKLADIAFLKAQEVDFTNGRIIYNEKVSDISV